MSHTIRSLVLLVLVFLAADCSGPAEAAAPPRPLVPVGPATLQLWQDAAIFTPVRRLIDGAGPGDPVWVEMYEFSRHPN